MSRVAITAGPAVYIGTVETYLKIEFLDKPFLRGNLFLTLECGINIQIRLLIFEVFSRGYVLVKGGYVC